MELGTAQIERVQVSEGSTQDRLPPLDELQQYELSSTQIAPATARFATWAFVFLITLVPAYQTAAELLKSGKADLLGIAKPMISSVKRSVAGEWNRACTDLAPYMSKQFLGQFEKDLEDQSIPRKFIRPILQTWLTQWLRFGNHLVVVGRNGWLYYQPGVDYVVGPDMLSEQTLAWKARKMVNSQKTTDPQPDPRPAIIKFHRDCARAGIHLVVLPIPDKAMLQPSGLTGRMESGDRIPVPNNVGYSRLMQELRAHGVDVFDPAPRWLDPGQELYLRHDTHWRPDFMQNVAKGLADHIRSRVNGFVSSEATFEVRPMHVARRGDLVDMLKLRNVSTSFEPQPVALEQVRNRKTKSEWRADESADVLVLGDSFTNIYSDASLGWGTSAGFAEHLSYELQRPVDVIALNGGGASATRAELARSENRQRAALKKLIVYQFTVRDLANENWNVFDVQIEARSDRRVPGRGLQTRAEAPVTRNPQLTRPELDGSARKDVLQSPSDSVLRGAHETNTAPKSRELILQGELIQISQLPDPESVAYPDCLTFSLVRVDRVVSGSYEDPVIMAVFLGMKNNKWLPPATYRPGKRLQLTLLPFKQADPEIRRTQRVDDLNDFEHIPYYVLGQEEM